MKPNSKDKYKGEAKRKESCKSISANRDSNKNRNRKAQQEATSMKGYDISNDEKRQN